MGRLIYKKSIKAVLIVLQALAAGVLMYCLLNIGFWMEGSFSLRELSRSYEESELFLRQVDTILYNKIRGQDNTALFETNGEFDPELDIDIQSYGVAGSTVKDMNTTYCLGDLLEFYENGGQLALHEALAAASAGQGKGRDAGEILDARSDELETILPVTGISLSECSRWYSDSASFIYTMYTLLDEVSSDLYARYQEYTQQQDESWSADAPSNLRYCIENTATGVLYTNTGEDSYGEAAAAIDALPDFVSLYKGERSFNIMVADPESVLNPAAEAWFMEERFVNTNERVCLAVDLAYPVGDILQTYAGYFAERETVVWTSVITAVLCAVVLAGAFVLTLAGAGWSEGHITPVQGRIDRVPTELAAGIYVIIAVLYLLALSVMQRGLDDIFSGERVALSGIAASAWLVFWSACAGLVRRVRMKTLWSNSISRMLVRTWKQVTAARAASGQLLFCYIIFFILNFMFLLFGRVGIFLVLVLDMAVLLYLLRDMASKQSVWEGIHQISRGDLTYKIDTSTLQGEAYEMAKAVNEMGDGLQKAVDAIVRNERLKAELITNVSHDIKTPLTSIVNYVDLLKRENLEGERVQHYIEVLDQKSQRLRQLTEDLVEASKISSGNIELHMERLQLQSMIWQASGEFEERFEEHGLVMRCSLAHEPVFIMADGRQLWRILENLLGNICKYAREGTEISVRLESRDGRAYLALENTSREPLPEDAQELTGRFVRGDRSRSTEGSGLGLSIAQSLTELQGGTFEISAQGERFLASLTFPVS